jgi:hypothetical protein
MLSKALSNTIPHWRTVFPELVFPELALGSVDVTVGDAGGSELADRLADEGESEGIIGRTEGQLATILSNFPATVL